jgi:alpha-galactosidase
MYNNYTHFGDNFNDTLLTDVAHAASAAGIRQIEVDGGWYTTTGNIGKQINWMSNTGDWMVDKVKSPYGLRPVYDTICQLSMERRLMISVGSAASTSKVFQDHSEWPILDEQGKPTDLHGTGGADLNTMCFGTLCKNYIKGKILTLVKALGLKYVSLDLTVLTSAYVMDIGSGDVMLPAILIIKVSVCKRM